MENSFSLTRRKKEVLEGMNFAMSLKFVFFQADYNFGPSIQELTQNGCNTCVCAGTSAWSRLIKKTIPAFPLYCDFCLNPSIYFYP
jgi:hypothetical protein